MAQSTKTIFSKRPGVDIIPSEVFTTATFPTPQASDLKDGQLLVETLYLSVDPIMSHWIRGKKYEYMDLKEGDAMPSMAVTRVVASRAPEISVGDIGTSFTGWTTHAIINATDFDKRTLYPGVKATDFLNVIGATGLTGYCGMEKCGQPKEGDLVVVSTAAGATGSVAAQTAKNRGARVIGITGSAEKVRWLEEEVGLDVVLNYKDADFEKRFAEVTGGKIDVYFDNVGGRMLELAIENLNIGARIAICGDISSYENPNPQGIKNYFSLALRDATMKGVNVYTYFAEQDAAYSELGQWMREGKMKRTETVVRGGVEKAPEVLIDVFKGKNIGKMMIEVKNPHV